MREIKFRGHNKTFGWRYGDYKFTRLDEMPEIYHDGYPYVVDIDSIGQFTGLHDKNGKEIYEGDILKRTSTINQWKRELFEEIIGKVTIKIGMTYLVGKRKHGYLDEELKISNCKELLLSPDLFEVIGDIHSNPELLESGE